MFLKFEEQCICLIKVRGVCDLYRSGRERERDKDNYGIWELGNPNESLAFEVSGVDPVTCYI